MAPLSSDLRKSLDKAVVAAREEAESACEAALRALGVPADQAPPGISDQQRAFRNALRAKQRQLGGAFEQLASECAYEQWHLMLFARFLAENDLLIHPSGAPVTLSEVAELAREEAESDPWLLAARYAAAMLPGIFKTADPCVLLPLAPEGRKALEAILEALPPEVFTADDALGWVYQFWQTKKKKEVNASERKIGGADLAPVTQLFTEHYMVRFLLENSLGAWWAARHPESPLLTEWEYLRYSDEGEPAVGRFEGWPETAAEVKVMDPFCGSGHFLVAAFDMLWKMRAEEEGLSTREAADAVLVENLYGLELDARCVQLGAFALALAAWKESGYHELPPLSLACSGIPTRGSLEDWTKLAKSDQRLERALARLHELFREADTLGSLIDPRGAVEDGSLLGVPFEEVAPLLERALASDPDPVAAVFGESAREVARAATMLATSYTVVATNVPYLQRGKQSSLLAKHALRHFDDSKADLATMCLRRLLSFGGEALCVASVTPQNWLFLRPYRAFREALLREVNWICCCRLGAGAFSTISGEVVKPILAIHSRGLPHDDSSMFVVDASVERDGRSKATLLASAPLEWVAQVSQLANPEAIVTLDDIDRTVTLDGWADSYEGMSTGDAARFSRNLWELPAVEADWARWQSSATSSAAWTGLSKVLYWENGAGALAHSPGAYLRGRGAWRRQGVGVTLMGSIAATLYAGDLFDDNVAVLVPKSDTDLPAVYSYARSEEFVRQLRAVNPKVAVKTQFLLRVPFDLAHWQKVAEEQYPDGLPEPRSEDPTQWLFKGTVVGSTRPLHVALARLLGYRWPDQEPDELDALADEDGIVCLPSVAGERPADERLRGVIASAYGDEFAPQVIDDLLGPEGSRNLEEWLLDKAFSGHAKLFRNRPFIWHIWDGRNDGFATLVNYHALDHQTLEKLAFTHLNWWIERQRTDMANGVAGAEARLAAAQELQRKLKLILEGEAPYDIYVRWKPLAEQPLGWEPDLNDGVRLNVRPFVTAGVLRAKLPSIKWGKDRGKNPDGSERPNDLHFTLAEKRAAREEAARSG